MKNMKKFASILLALVLAMALTVPALADETTKGTITISNAINGETYDIYKIFDLVSYSGTNFSYSVSGKWVEFCEKQAKDYVAITNSNANAETEGNIKYVSWKMFEEKDGVKTPTGGAEFAKLAIKFAQDNNISATRTEKATSNPVSFTNLDLGYYLVDSSTGVLCSLDTTTPTVDIKEKNDKPSVDKDVQEDSLKTGATDTTNGWQGANDAQIGDTVNYKSTITVGKGAQNYVLYDQMSAGLTYNRDVVVYKNAVEVSNLLPANSYEVKNATDRGFTLDFTDAFEATLNPDEISSLIVVYSATLNKDAVIGPDKYNSNKVILNYGDKTDTDWNNPDSETKTYTYAFDLIKTDGADGHKLSGATFVLYDAQTGGNIIPLVKVSDNVYRIAAAGEEGSFTTPFEVPENGKVVINGVDVQDKYGAYWLEEITAPTGYNKLTERVEVKFTRTFAEDGNSLKDFAHLDRALDTATEGTDGKSSWGTECINVENKTGAQMPETGGIGTTIFYTLGGLMVVAAGVLLVTKRRMHSNG